MLRIRRVCISLSCSLLTHAVRQQRFLHTVFIHRQVNARTHTQRATHSHKHTHKHTHKHPFIRKINSVLGAKEELFWPKAKSKRNKKEQKKKIAHVLNVVVFVLVLSLVHFGFVAISKFKQAVISWRYQLECCAVCRENHHNLWPMAYNPWRPHLDLCVRLSKVWQLLTFVCVIIVDAGQSWPHTSQFDMNWGPCE